jgi:Fic family protein
MCGIFTGIMNVKEILLKIDSLKKEIDQVRPLKPELEHKIAQKFRLDWNYHSNHLEGNTLTYGETTRLILFDQHAEGKSTKDHNQIIGHNEALLYINSIINEQRPITEAFIRELHLMILKEPYEADAITADGQRVKKQIKIGQYKTTPNHVLTVTGEIFRYASPEETPALMGDLMDWYNVHRVSTETHAFWLAAMFHFKFVLIHPFDDGNGRLVRILMNYILLQNGYPPIIIKTEEKSAYISALEQADTGNLEFFVVYMGRKLVQSMELYLHWAKGGHIDEVGDIDKEILLLERKLEEIGKEEIREEKTKESIKNVIKESISPLVEELLKQLQKIDKFYRDVTIVVYKNNNGKVVNRKEVIAKMEFLALNKADERDELNDLMLTYSFSGFKKAGVNDFGDSIQVNFHFERYKYIVNFRQRNDLRIEKLYHQMLSKEEVDVFVTTVVKRSIDYIKQMVDQERN